MRLFRAPVLLACALLVPTAACDDGSAPDEGLEARATDGADKADEPVPSAGTTASADVVDDPMGSTGGSSGGDEWDDEGASFVGPMDVGSSEYTPIYECDDPNANIPEGVECMDATAGNEADAADQQRVVERFGSLCALERICGEQWGIDCGAAADGPYHYVTAETLEVLSSTWFEPPAGWNCPIF